MADQPATQNSSVFFMGIIFLVISMIFIGLSIYLLPHLLFGWIYDVPAFILSWRETFVSNYEMNERVASVLIFLAFLIPGLLAVAGATLCSHQLGEKATQTVSPGNEAKRIRLRRDLQSTSMALIRVIMIVLAIIIIVEIIEYLLFIDPEAVVEIEREL